MNKSDKQEHNLESTLYEISLLRIKCWSFLKGKSRSQPTVDSFKATSSLPTGLGLGDWGRAVMSSQTLIYMHEVENAQFSFIWLHRYLTESASDLPETDILQLPKASDLRRQALFLSPRSGKHSDGPRSQKAASNARTSAHLGSLIGCWTWR